jgi:hypothetical protein
MTMLRRLMQRRKLLIGGCVFAAVVLGVACTGISPVQAGGFDVQTCATGDSMISASSDWAWSASDGDIRGTSPLSAGQELVQGSYSGSVLVSGPGTMTCNRGLLTSELLSFSTGQEVYGRGSTILSESLTVNSFGSPAAGVTCGSDQPDAGGANLTRQAYHDYAGASTMFMADSLNYHSAGDISQGDSLQPDRMVMEVDATGSGTGLFSAGSRSLTGIGNTSALGYSHAVSEKVRTAGRFMVNGRARWSAFNSPI